MLIPLREKYRNPNSTTLPNGTKIWRGQKFRLNPGQAGNGRAGQFGCTTKIKNKRGTIRPRRRAYGPF